MKIVADTDMPLRIVLPDDGQRRAAAKAMETADAVAIGVHALCELVWVLARHHRTSRADIAATIRRLVAAPNVVVDRPAVAAGLAHLDAGGDFANGVIAFEGRRLGGDAFVSFDHKTAKLHRESGCLARLLA